MFWFFRILRNCLLLFMLFVVGCYIADREAVIQVACSAIKHIYLWLNRIPWGNILVNILGNMKIVLFLGHVL